MKKLMSLVLTVICVITVSCSYIKNYDKPHLELSDQQPYELKITDFDWSYGVTGLNQFNGDFDKLDHKVYDLLKGKTGICKVYLEAKDKDKYGNGTSTMNYIGDINIDELNKYQDWHYWQKESGIRTLIYNHSIKTDVGIPQTDTVSQTSVSPQAPVIQPQPVTSTETPKVYGFGIADLYPTPEKQADLDSNRYIVDGRIGDVNFNNGVMQIITNEGEEVTVQFYPLDASSYTARKLMIALKPGNTIKSVCARAGASTMDLVSAQVTEGSAATPTVHKDTVVRME